MPDHEIDVEGFSVTLCHTEQFFIILVVYLFGQIFMPNKVRSL